MNEFPEFSIDFGDSQRVNQRIHQALSQDETQLDTGEEEQNSESLLSEEITGITRDGEMDSGGGPSYEETGADQDSRPESSVFSRYPLLG